MTEEEMKAAQQAEADAKAKEEAETAARANESDEDKKAREEKEAQDEEARLQAEHKAELEAERAKRKKAEDELAERRFKESEIKRKQEESGESGEEKPLTRAELAEELNRNRQELLRETQSATIKDKVAKLTSSQIEAELVTEIHKSRTFPSWMTLDEQLEEAYVIANRKRILAHNSELKRAIIHDKTVNKNAADTHRDSPSPSEPQHSEADKGALKAAGFVWDGKQNAYKLVLKSRTVFKSKDLKKTWTVQNRG